MGVEGEMMSALSDAFLDLMEHFVMQYRLLADLLLQEEKAIITFSIERFNRVREEKQVQIVRIQAIDSKRRVIIRKMAAELGLPPANLTLEKMASKLDQPVADRLRCLSADLKTVLDVVAERNARNNNLIGHSLSLIRSSIDFLTHLMIPAPVYGRNGGVVPSMGSGLRFRSAA